jgi:UDP-4-amino-4,6-dideoxy-N-acetyl-beta-L-altrosamine N-acetyltransferase
LSRYHDYRLRPLSKDDGALVLGWRNQERVRVNMYTDHVIGEDEHGRWLAAALVDQTARYLIAEFRERAVGFVSLTRINSKHRTCMWAFYLGEADAPRGSGAAMEYLALTYAFDTVGIRKLQCEVFAFNASVIRLHERFGFKREGLFVRQYAKGAKFEDVVALALFDDEWAASRQSMYGRCFET